MILPLTGKQYSEKVAENCVAYWKSIDKYSDAESKAIDKFLEVFKDETFPPGASILFTQSPSGSLTISFSKDGSIPEHGNAVIENKQMSEALLESIIGKHGVSPAAKQSLGAAAGKLDGIIDTVSTTHALVPLLSLLKPHSKLILVGAPKKPLELPVFPLIMGRKMITASATGGLKEVQEMIDFDFFQIGILMIFMPCFNVLFVGFVMMRFGLYRLNLSVACI